MNRTLIASFVISLLTFGGLSLYAQDTERGVIYYRLNESKIDVSYRDNAKNIYKILHLITSPEAIIDSVIIIGHTSPEGTQKRNRELAHERALSTKDFLLEHSPDSILLNSSHIHLKTGHTDWVELKEWILQNYNNTDKSLILENLKIVSSDEPENKVALDKLESFMTDLRVGTIVINYTRSTPERSIKNLIESPVAQLDTIDTQHAKEIIASDSVDKVTKKTDSSDSKEKVFLGLKTNMLYNLAMTPNIGAEFNLGKGWSVGVNWGYAWWKSDPKAFYWRVYGGELDIRKYFGKISRKRALSGHHLGIYGQMLTYDFDLGKAGILSKLSYGAGVEYGYSLPVTRTLNVDFGIGVGYFGGEYKVYDPIDDHYVWRETRRRHWLGPTKAEISLVWLIGNKTFRKGGAQ